MRYTDKTESLFERGILPALEQAFYSTKGRKSEPALQIQWWQLTVQDHPSTETKKELEAEKLAIWKAEPS